MFMPVGLLVRPVLVVITVRVLRVAVCHGPGVAGAQGTGGDQLVPVGIFRGKYVTPGRRDVAVKGAVVTSGNERRHELARTLSTVARQLQAQPSEAKTLDYMMPALVDTVPGADYAGITLVNKGGRTATAKAPTHEVVRLLDEVQNKVDEGPCLDAVWQQHTVTVPDMSLETRWPKFAAEAHRLGIGSMMSFQLYVEGDNLGALNLHSARPYAFSPDAQLIGELFASHAAVALAGTANSRQLNEALATRDMIGQAKGILMKQENVDGPTAFAMLVQASQHANIKLSEVASWLVDEHNQPGRAARPLSDL